MSIGKSTDDNIKHNQAQQKHVPVLSSRTQIDNVFLGSEDEFVGSRASREVSDGVLLVNTSTYATDLDLGAKMNSRDGLEREAQNSGLDIQFGDFLQCADVNRVTHRALQPPRVVEIQLRCWEMKHMLQPTSERQFKPEEDERVSEKGEMRVFFGLAFVFCVQWEVSLTGNRPSCLTWLWQEVLPTVKHDGLSPRTTPFPFCLHFRRRLTWRTRTPRTSQDSGSTKRGLLLISRMTWRQRLEWRLWNPDWIFPTIVSVWLQQAEDVGAWPTAASLNYPESL